MFSGETSQITVPLQVEEGRKAIINMTATAFPNSVSYKWTKEIFEENKKSGAGQAWTKTDIKQVRI